MGLSFFVVYLFSFLALATFVAHGAPVYPRFDDGSSQKIRGVNLDAHAAGWFSNHGTPHPCSTKPWTFGEKQDKSTAEAALKSHWATFITEQDFSDIAAAGLNHVRLPIGYWAWDVSKGEPFVQGQLPYLRNAVEWGGKHNVKVIIDLHGAPGSQNGFDNSGQKKDSPEWHTDPENVNRTNTIIKQIANEFKNQSSVVAGIAALNEPAGFKSQDLVQTTKQYWQDSYGNVRYPYGTDQKSDLMLIIHHAFQPLDFWDGFLTKPNFEGVMMDTHIYQTFSEEEVKRSEDEHIKVACSNGDQFSNFTASQLPLLAGEFSPAADDCAPDLLGRGTKSLFAQAFGNDACKGRTGSVEHFTDEWKTFMRKYWEAQVQSFEKGAGWMMWTWKTESAAEWSYKDGLKGGWIPKDPTERKFPDVCKS